MARQKPPRRLVLARTSDNEKRRLRDPSSPQVWLLDLANRVGYEAYAKHKLAPHAFGLVAYSGPREDATFGDGHAQFELADMQRLPALLRRGILAGLVGHNDAQGDPTLIWTVDDNGWIYEGRLTIPGRALYHGYPVLPSEAIARPVVARYVQHMYNEDADLVHSAQQVQERYS